MIRTVVLDFDGTFTDVEAEGEPFTVRFRAMLGDLLGRDVAPLWEEAMAGLLEAPELHGWVIEGRVVAPATSDPYLRATAAAQRIFDVLGVLRESELRTEVLQMLYRIAYRASRTAFRPEAREVLDALLARDVAVFVVTNSDPALVSAKLDALELEHRARVRLIGDAKKYVVGELSRAAAAFDALPESDPLVAIARPVYLRRPYYFESLERISRETGARYEEILVCGDIYELDLALPAALGAHVHLLVRPTTPRFEKDAITALGARGLQGSSLRDVIARLA